MISLRALLLKMLQGRPEKSGDRQEHRRAGMSSSVQTMFAKALELYQRGVDGDREAVQEAYRILERVRRLAPQNSVVEAYYGSITSLLGRDAIDPEEKIKKVVAGLKILDHAVTNDPENVEIRILRAYVCSRLPDAYFHRLGMAAEDFAYLVSRYERTPDIFTVDFYHQLLYDLGTAYKNLERKDEAASVWAKLLARTNDPKYHDLVRQEETKPTNLSSIFESSAGPAAGISGSDGPGTWAEGESLHRRALLGDKEAVHKASAFFAQALRADPGNHLLVAYNADCISMTGRDAGDPGAMFAGAIKAMKEMDAAISGDPDNVRIRLLRANHSLRLPEAFFHRTATAVEDLEYLVARYERERSILQDESFWQVLYDLGAARHRMGLTGEAAAAWKRLGSLNPSPRFKAMLDAMSCHSQPVSPFRLFWAGRATTRQEGEQWHDLAIAGDRDAGRKALAYWQKAFKAAPDDPLAQAYYGSSLALAGRDASDTSVIFNNTIKGLQHLNRALAQDSGNIRIRILRAYLMFSLPEAFFHLTGQAIEDFEYLITAYERDNSVLPKEQYHQILHDLGLACERIGDNARAAEVWRRLLEEDPESAYGTLVAARLTRMETGGPADELAF